MSWMSSNTNAWRNSDNRSCSTTLVTPGSIATSFAAVSQLAIGNREAIAADHVTATVAVVSGRIRRGATRSHLLAHAISTVSDAARGDGNPLISVDV